MLLLYSILVVTIVALLISLVIHVCQKKWAVDEDPLVQQIDRLLPQTQCAQCGYPGCRPYAEAIAKGQADINLCPPGGEQTVQALAELLHQATKPLAKQQPEPDRIAYIDEQQCIGCVLCIKACPVDAILGASKQMHTVIQQECTGCELCVPVCPVDCIDMVASQSPLIQWNWQKPNAIDQLRPYS